MKKQVQLNLTVGEFLYLKQSIHLVSSLAAGDVTGIIRGTHGCNELGPFHHGGLGNKLNLAMEALDLTDEEILAEAPGLSG